MEGFDEYRKSKCGLYRRGTGSTLRKDNPSFMNSHTHVTKEIHLQCPILLYPASLMLHTLYLLLSFPQMPVNFFFFFAIIQNVFYESKQNKLKSHF